MSDDTSSYGRIRERLDDILLQIRTKDVPLEKSLDLYEEAIRLGGMAAEMIDNTDFTDEEIAAVDDEAAAVNDETAALDSLYESVESQQEAEGGASAEEAGESLADNPETEA
ncbi:MAG: exodeoxyribonuclease VII small subunit [Coriobacteriia bacterium]|nr:exodeoxyribonuclease VII small subunit [Coriobacteriia bacterium]